MEQQSSSSGTNFGTPSTATATDDDNSTDSSSSSTRYSSILSTLRFLRAPLSTLLSDYALVPPSSPSSNNNNNNSIETRPDHFTGSDSALSSGDNNGEVSIRIIAGQEQNRLLEGEDDNDDDDDGELGQIGMTRIRGQVGEIDSSTAADINSNNNATGSGSSTTGGGGGATGNTSSYQQQYDLQQAARLIEQIMPFSLLLLVVFIRQHLQGNYLYIV